MCIVLAPKAFSGITRNRFGGEGHTLKNRKDKAMNKKRTKQYLMQEIPEKVGGAGRFRAYFVGDGYSIDANTEILPQVIETGGMKVSEGVARDLIKSFLKCCVSHTATTGETVNIADLMTVTLAIRGSYERRKSSAPRDNVHVVVRLLEDLRPTVSFTMSNALSGKVLTLQSVTSPGCEPGYVRQGVVATINGLNLPMLDGDTVSATMKNASGEEVTVLCTFTGVGSTRLDVTIPSVFDVPDYVGKEIVFTVCNRCGDPDLPQDSDTITAVLLAGEPPPGPVPPAPTLTAGYTEGHENNPGVIFTDGGFIMAGTNLTGCTWSVEWEGTSGARTETIDPEAVEVTGGTSAIIAPAALATAVGDTEAGMPIFIRATNAGGSARFMGESSGE